MRLTISDIQAMKVRGERIPMLTAYDYPFARLLDEAGIPMLLVGDSLGMVVLGHDTTLPVTVEIMLHHTKAVVRGTQRALIVADLPFLSYQVSIQQAMLNAGRLIQEGGAQAVKLEGGEPVLETVSRLTGAGIPVMGHLGLTPQSVHQMGGFRVQGKTREAVEQLLNDARGLEAAGAFSIVLEGLPAPVAKLVTEAVTIPTIGIGAGVNCDGQVQVITDLLHLIPGDIPKHAKAFAEVGEIVQSAVKQYSDQVIADEFPTTAESFRLPKGFSQEELAEVGAELAPRD